MHTIRLRGPWQLEPIRCFGSDTGRLPAATRATMPADWAAACGAGFRGCVRYSRTFQKPTGLDGGARVWLVVEPPRTLGVVNLNGTTLGNVRLGESAGRFEVTQLLADRNALEIEVTHPELDDDGKPADDGGSGGLVGEVRLEIEEN
jgi:hypothetical protein